MHAKFDLKCINFKCILQSRKTVGRYRTSEGLSKLTYRIELLVMGKALFSLFAGGGGGCEKKREW